jgi:hypothetical protein
MPSVSNSLCLFPFLLTKFSIVTAVSPSLRQGEKPPYVPAKRHVTFMGAESLNFMLNYGDHPLVSPDYPKRATIETSSSDEIPCTQKESLSVTNEVLTMAMCTRFPREHRVLAPRPGKKTTSLLCCTEYRFISPSPLQ